MPDNWEYDEPEILKWNRINSLPYSHTIEVLEKMNLKKAIQCGTFKVSDISGLTVTPQEPKFNYKLNGGL